MLRTTREAEGERQPFSLDGQVWITADARVDGRADLAAKLASAGGPRPPADAGDAELILRAYLAWGDDCVRHLIGDFAFAVWDGRRRRLFCARDHFGVKPFYYAQPGGGLVFSNTLNCLRGHPRVADELNDLAVGDFLLFGFNQEPDTTIFSDIRRLPAAHYLTWSSGAPQVTRYWELPTSGEIRYRRAEDYVLHFRELFETAVGDRLRADRAGVLMSGGLDSTAVAATAHRLLSRHSRPFDLRAYCGVYDQLIPDDERYYSGLVARALNMPIRYLAADAYELFERCERPELCYPEPYDEPLGAFYFDQIQQVAAHARVALTGQGGDPLLGVPSAFLTEALKKKQLVRFAAGVVHYLVAYGALPRLGFRRALRRRLGVQNGEHRPTYPRWLNPAFAGRHNLRERWETLQARPAPVHPVRPDAYNNYSSHWWSLMFEQYDASWVSCPVEVRHPLFDLRLVTYALAIPPVPWCLNKSLLRSAMRYNLPERVRLRPKTPMQDDPVRVRLGRQEGRGLVSIEARVVEEYLDPETVKDIKRGVIGREDASVNGLRPVYLALWLQQKEMNHEQLNDGEESNATTRTEVC